MGKNIFILIGIAFIVVSFFVPTGALTNDGFSLPWFLRIMGFWFAGLPFLLALGFGFIKKRKQKQRKFLLQNGIKATATILSAKRTGVFLNKIPQFVFEVNVSIDGREGFVTECKKYIRFIDLSKINEGMQIAAYVNPKNENKILLLWEKEGVGEAF